MDNHHIVFDDDVAILPADDNRNQQAAANTADYAAGVALSASNSECSCHAPSDLEASGNASKTAIRQLVTVSILCCIFMIGEIVGGVVSNSLALLTDASHLASDLASFFISLFAIYLGRLSKTKNLSFGYYRAEVLGALVSILLIWTITAVLVFLAVDRVRHPESFTIKADEMLVVASLGVLFNIIMGMVLQFDCCCRGASSVTSGFGGHGHSHAGGGGDASASTSHAHGQSPQQRSQLTVPDNAAVSSVPPNARVTPSENDGSTTVASEARPPGKIKKNINVYAAYIHVLGDLVQSIGVVIAAIIIKVKPEWKLADPICTFVFSILVLFTTLNVLRDITRVLMEGVPRGVNFQALRSELLAVRGVQDVHSLRVWALTLNKPVLIAHLAIDLNSDAMDVLDEAKRIVVRHGIGDNTIQIEYFREAMQNCNECRPPR